MSKEFRKLNATLPEGITLADDGVQLEGPSGAKLLNPWSAFTGWREGTGYSCWRRQKSAFSSCVWKTSPRQSVHLSDISSALTYCPKIY
jgi:hypothetical protein